MRKLLLSAVALAALSVCAPAHADNLPKQMLGDWCQIEQLTDDYRQLFTRNPKCGPNFGAQFEQHWIATGGSEGEGGRCWIKRVKRLYKDTYYVRTRCQDDEGISGPEVWKFILQLSGDYLISTTLSFNAKVKFVDEPEEPTPAVVLPPPMPAAPPAGYPVGPPQ